MNLWDESKSKDDLENKIKSITSNPNFIFFFIKDKAVYAATEDNRIVFAMMKNPDADCPKNWRNEATFIGYNLSKMVKDEQGVKSVFNYQDSKSIKVIDQEKAFNYLKKTHME